MKTNTNIVLIYFLFALAVTPLRADLPPEAQVAMQKGLLAAKEQQWDVAIQSFQEARKLAPAAPEIYYNLGLAESNIPGRELRAISWFGAYLAATTNAPNAANARNAIADLQIKNKEDINGLLKFVQDAANKANQGGNDYELHQVLHLWVQDGDFTSALKIAVTLNYQRDSELEEIAAAQAKAGDITGALNTADLIQGQDFQSGQDIKSKALADIAGMQAKAGDGAGAREHFALALKTYESISTNGINNLTGLYSTKIYIAGVEAEAGEIADAKELLLSAQKTTDSYVPTGYSHNQSDARKTISQTLVKIGDIQDALNIADSIKYKLDADEAYEDIANALIKSGDLAGALKIVNSFQDGWNKCTILDGVAEAQAEAGDIVGAQKTIDLFQGVVNDSKSIYRDGALMSVVKAQAEAGDIVGAQKTADLLQEEADKHNIQSEIDANKPMAKASGQAQAKAESGDFAAAIKIADTLEDVTNNLWKSAAFGTIAWDQANKGDFTNAQKSAESIINPWYKGRAEDAIACFQAKAGDMAGAQKTAGLIEAADWKSRAMADIVIAQTNTAWGQPTPEIVEPVMEWLANLDDSYDSGHDYTSNSCPLNSDVFLNSQDSLITQSSSDPSTISRKIEVALGEIIQAKKIVDQRLKQQGKMQMPDRPDAIATNVSSDTNTISTLKQAIAIANYQQSISGGLSWDAVWALAHKFAKSVAATDTWPSIPDEAQKHFLMGQTMFKSAANTNDFQLAFSEFFQASKSAPWVATIWYDMALAEESAGNYYFSTNCLLVYMDFKLSDADAQHAQNKLYEMEAKQKMQEQNAQADHDRQFVEAQERFSVLINKLDGAVFVNNADNSDLIFFVRQGLMNAGDAADSNPNNLLEQEQSGTDYPNVPNKYNPASCSYVNPKSNSEIPAFGIFWGDIKVSDDGQTLTESFDNGNGLKHNYYTRKQQ